MLQFVTVILILPSVRNYSVTWEFFPLPLEFFFSSFTECFTVNGSATSCKVCALYTIHYSGSAEFVAVVPNY